MDNKDEILTVFVAMPGKMETADWKDAEAVKEYFFKPIAKRLQEVTGRSVELSIEIDKKKWGPIYSSMFSEAWKAEVYRGELDKGYNCYHEAIERVPPEQRKSVLSSVISPIEELMSIGVITDQSKRTIVQRIIDELKVVSS